MIFSLVFIMIGFVHKLDRRFSRFNFILNIHNLKKVIMVMQFYRKKNNMTVLIIPETFSLKVLNVLRKSLNQLAHVKIEIHVCKSNVLRTIPK